MTRTGRFGSPASTRWCARLLDAERRAIADASDSLEDELRSVLGIDRFLDGLTGAALRERAQFATTSNIAGIKAGYSGPGMKTVLPAEATAWLDFRLVPNQTPEGTLAALRRHLALEGFGELEIEVVGSAEPAGTPVEHPFVKRVVDVAEAVAQHPASIAPRSAATLPIVASLERQLAVPGLSAPGNPFYVGSQAHAPNEHIRVDDVDEAVRFTHALFEALAETR